MHNPNIVVRKSRSFWGKGYDVSILADIPFSQSILHSPVRGIGSLCDSILSLIPEFDSVETLFNAFSTNFQERFVSNLRGRPRETFSTGIAPYGLDEGEEELFYVDGVLFLNKNNLEEDFNFDGNLSLLQAEPFFLQVKTKFSKFLGSKKNYL
jgi:hypothetical protein